MFNCELLEGRRLLSASLGSATPIVWGDRVFVLSAVKTDRAAKADELPEPDPAFKV